MTTDRQEGPARVRRLTPPLTRELLVGLFLLLCFGFFQQTPIWNEPSRYDLVVAIVDHHTTRIDANQDNTGDKAFFQGHYYSDKEPGSAFLGVPAYAAMRFVRAITQQPPPDENEAIQVLAFVECAIPTALLAMLLIRLLRPLAGERWAVLVAVGYGLGTMAFPFATMYFGHATTTFFLFAAFFLLRNPHGWPGRWRPALAGVCAGLAVLVDFSAGIGVVALAIYSLRHAFQRPFLQTFRRPSLDAYRALLLFIAGGIPALILLLVYDKVSFGSLFSTGYTHLANSGFAAGQSEGILGVTAPRPGVLWDLLFGSRGLLRLSPWLVLAPAGLWAARRRGLRWEIGVSAALCVAYLLVNSGYYLPFGGATPGPRFLSPMLPFAAILVGLAPRGVRYLAAVLIVPSIALTTLATATMPNAFEAIANPLTDLWIPMIRGGLIVETTGWLRWGLPSLLALAALALAAACTAVAAWATVNAGSAVRRVGVGAGVVLGVLVISLGTPLDAPSEFGLTALAHAAGLGLKGEGVNIVDSGVTGIVTSDRRTAVRPWGQFEGRELGAGETRVVFTVFNSHGTSVFSVFFDRMTWSSDQRRTLAVEWSTKGVVPGTYRLTISVVSDDGSATYATVPDGSVFRIPPGYESGKA